MELVIVSFCVLQGTLAMRFKVSIRADIWLTGPLTGSTYLYTLFFGQELETDQRFDLILSDQTFEHLVDPLMNLRKIYSLLVVGGLAYIKVPNWWTFRRFLHGKKCLKDLSHYNYFTPRTLANLCRIEKLGFEILKVSPTLPDKVLPKIGHWIFNRIGIGDCSILIRKMPQGQQRV